MTPEQLNAYLKIAIPNHQNTLLIGQPGIGKTEIILEATKQLNANLIVSHAVTDNPTDYKGLGFPSAKKDHATFLPFGNLHTAMNVDKLTVWFFDDFGQAPLAVQSAGMQIFQQRRINGHEISPHISFIAATNRKEDKANVTGILEPVKSRFRIIQLETHHSDWITWAEDPNRGNMPAELIAFIQWRPELLNQFKPTLDLVNTPNPRNVARVGEAMKLGYPQELEQEIFAGDCGIGWSSEFCGFLQFFRQNINPDQILMDPSKLQIPTTKERPAILYALARAIAMKATTKWMGNIGILCDLIPVEFATLMMTLIARMKPELKETAGFTKWAIKNNKYHI